MEPVIIQLENDRVSSDVFLTTDQRTAKAFLGVGVGLVGTDMTEL